MMRVQLLSTLTLRVRDHSLSQHSREKCVNDVSLNSWNAWCIRHVVNRM